MTDGVHHLARDGFAAAADAYERGRPGYPPDAVTFLASALGLQAGRVVVDVGAGTGKLTRALVTTGADVVAVEPVDAMRDRLADELPTVDVRDGTAEAMPVDDAAADAVTAGQSFHWFDGPRALAELRRVLRPRGRLGLVWNVRDESVGWVARLSAVIEPYSKDAPRHARGAWKRAFDETGGFGRLRLRSFRHASALTVDQVVDRYLSISFIAVLDEAERVTVEAAIRDVLSSDPDTGGRVRVQHPYRTDVYWTQRS
ncbi:MAG: class I SAM-dependent methyltransferase [Actinobacteria bacterium]|nr:class I SAM-dependent methyltransferase [Actinomycetota bacterium]